MTEFEVKLPEDATLEINKNEVVAKGKLGQLKRTFKLEKMKIEKKDNLLVLKMDEPKSKEKAYMGSVAAHMKNMLEGVSKGHKYKLKVVYKHFPINVSVEKDKFVIKNFAGEKKPRMSKILDGAKVTVKNEIIEVDGMDIEKVGQTAANIEKATRIRKKDIRIFQDGIFIIQKGAE